MNTLLRIKYAPSLWLQQLKRIMYKTVPQKEDISTKLADLQVDVTCLSPRVYHILCEAGLEESRSNNLHILDGSGLIAWTELVKNLQANTEDTYEYFVASASGLAHAFQCSEAFIKPLSENLFKQKFSQWFQWTSSPEVSERCFTILRDGSDTSTHLALLLMLPVLERSLGDVFLIKGKQCPSMIKDLLVTKELEEIFGKSIIQLLRIVLGPPISLNLRNVTWHGFPQPGELPPRYGYFMLHVIASLGKVLHTKGIDTSQIPHRSFVAFPQIQHLTGIFPDVCEKECDIIEELTSESQFVLHQMKPLWRRAVESFRQARYGDCVVLLLPQLEHGLRRLFAVANNCPERVLTAENTVLFTTFDEILALGIDNTGTNMLHHLTGSSYITLLMDMLVYPEGPRLRDRFSHGETSFEPAEDAHQQELQAIANHVLAVSVSFCVLCLQKESKLHKVTYIHNVQKAAKNYTSVFHPIALYKLQLKQLCEVLSNGHKIQRPNRENIGTKVKWEESQKDGAFEASNVYRSGKRMLLALGNRLPNCILSILQPFYSLVDFSQVYIDIKVKTLYRSFHYGNKPEAHATTQQSTSLGVSNSKEDEIIGLLRKIVSECLKVCTQSESSLCGKYSQWVGKTLRSRQRDTYRRMLDIYPYITSGLRQVLLILVLNLHLLAEDKQQLLAKQLRFLKSVLQYCENLASFTSPDKNRWEEAQKYTDELMTTCLTIEF